MTAGEKKMEKKEVGKKDMAAILEKIEKELKEVEDSVRSLEEIAKELESLKKREKELIEGGQFLMEKIEQKVTILEMLGLMNDELAEKISNFKDIFKVRTRASRVNNGVSGRGRGRKVIIDGEEFSSGAEACRMLGIETHGDTPIRALKRWAKREGRTIIEEEDKLIIE